MPQIIENKWTILSVFLIVTLAVMALSMSTNAIPYASASSALVCEDTKSNDVRDTAPIPLNTPLTCTSTTDNQRVVGGQWEVYNGNGNLYLESPFKSSSNTISFIPNAPKLWTVKVSYFDNVGQNFMPPLPLTESSVSFVVSSYKDNLHPVAVITVIK